MINFDNDINEFIRYTNNFDLTDARMKRKQEHSLRVMEKSNIIAKSLNLSKEEIEVATLIGLLHDIGRFMQLTKHDTFRDSKIFDHGEEGEKILKTNNYIRKYILDDKYDEIIFKAIRNHNKFKIEDGLSEKELLFAKIIRDADKLDILYESTCMFYIDKIDIMEEQEINPIVEKQFKDCKLIKYNDEIMKTEINHLIIYSGYIYDLNFIESFKILKNGNYINKTLDRFSFKKQNTIKLMEEVRQIASLYIDSKLK